jgi:hypothetical protein
VVAIKEDQYLEQLALSENFRGRLWYVIWLVR